MAQRSQQLSDERRRLRRLRRTLPARERLSAERRITASLRALGLLVRGRRVAVYLAADGEVDLDGLIRVARHAGVRLYAPRVTSIRRRSMAFVPLPADAPMTRNRYGIAEPTVSLARRLAPPHLDTVIAPLVGFDRLGHRLGMGAGFYDRALRRRLATGRAWRRPRFVGVAFACQETSTLSAAAWDVPLDLVVTERGVLRPSGARSQHRWSKT
ncbi:MAG TPA: 5-formyltetrahydrofolate cyclo-ligase [Steroidobacteraceae bacterium]